MSIIGQPPSPSTDATQPVQAVPPPSPRAPSSGPSVGADAENPYPLLLLFLPLALLALTLAKRIGAFRRRTVEGPPRVVPREPLAVLLMLAGLAVFLWLLAQMALLGVARAGGDHPTTPPASAAAAAPATRPGGIELTPEGTALIMVVPPLIAMGLTLLGHGTLRPRGVRLLGLGPAQLKRGVIQGLVGSAVMIPLVYLTAQLTELLWRMLDLRHPTSHALLYQMRDAPSAAVRFGLIAAAVLVAPLWEEFVFRGHLQTLLTYLPGRLLRRFNAQPVPPPDDDQPEASPAGARWASIVLTSLCFAAVHVQPGPFPYWMMPPIFVLAICVGYAYERTGNLWTTITMHAAFNTVSTILYFAIAR